MIKTLDEYRKLGCPEDYLKNGDQVDMPLARFITHIGNIEDKCGVFTSLHTDGICGNEPTTRAVKRHSYGDPYIYIGEVTLKERWNHSPELARKIFISSPYRAETKEKMDENITLAKKACRIIIKNGNLPIAPHLYFSSFLQDDDESERNLGIEYSLHLLDQCDEMLVITLEEGGTPYELLSEGMMTEVDHAVERGMKPKYISFYELWKTAI